MSYTGSRCDFSMIDCSFGAEQLRPAVVDLAKIADVPIAAYPNAGLPNELGEYDETPETTAAFLRGFADAGHIEVARVIPCTGGADLRALELELMRRGESFITRPCDAEFGVRRTNAGGW